MPHAPARMLGLAMLLTIAACAPGATTAPAPGTAAPTAAVPSTSATAAPTDAVGITGTWVGALVDPSGSYPVRVTLDACATTGAVCGEVEYLDMAQDDVVMCASELTLTAREGERFSFSERYVYRGWMCLPTTFGMTRTAGGGLDVEQFAGSADPCCRGALATSTVPTATPGIPEPLGALGRSTAATALGGGTTQYPGVGAGAIWLPLEDLGAVARIDPATGALVALVATGDPGSLDGLKSDPHSVVVGDAGIWVNQAAARAVGRIDPATNTVADTIALPVIPYALALDGTTLWVSSFEDDRVVRVDLATGRVVAEVAVSKPTGIAAGLGGVWVVRHRDDVLVRIDPASNKVVAEISLGKRGPNPTCGMCVENVVVAEGSVWTANNEGRSVSRVDPLTNKVSVTISLALRPWAVSAGGGRIWASQFDVDAAGAFVDPAAWGVASIDPGTGKVRTFPLPGALGVFWADDAVWVNRPGRRGDILVRVELAGS